MGQLYFWVKTLHIVFVAGWFVGLFYLPRLLTHLQSVPSDSHAERERLLLMSRKLYRWAGLMMIPAIVFGLVLWLGVGIGRGSGWIHAKMVLVVGAIGLHHVCRAQLRRFEQPGRQRPSAQVLRVFFVLAIVLLVGATGLAVFKPF